MSPAPARTRGGRARRRPRAPAPRPARGRLLADLAALAVVAAHACVLLLMWKAGVLPAWALAGFAALSALTLAAYARDKRAAVAATRRTPELTLHLLELSGGWPGALLAQRWLRHKNRKLRYQFAFWACVLLHEATLGHLWRLLATGAAG